MAEKQTYVAEFHVKHGVSGGLGVKVSGESRPTKAFEATSDLDAVITATKLAHSFADDYLSDPETGKTTVVLKELYEKDNGLVNILEEVKNNTPREQYDGVKKLFFPDGIHYRIERSWLDHIMRLDSYLKPLDTA